MTDRRHPGDMRRMLPLAAVTIAALALAGCSPSDTEPTPTQDTGASVDQNQVQSQTSRNVATSATFATGGGPAITYDETLIPAGSSVGVTSQEDGETTTVTLDVEGLQPDRTYGAHAHVAPCGPDGDDAGPHYQFEQDPVTPSVDPAFANPENEIWLDVTTDAEGAGSSTATVDWVAPDDRRPESVIIHEMETATGAGEAGTAGGRPGCITVGF